MHTYGTLQKRSDYCVRRAVRLEQVSAHVRSSAAMAGTELFEASAAAPPPPGFSFGALCKFFCCASCKARSGAGARFGLPIPISGQALQDQGPQWITRALRTSGAIAQTNRCTALTVAPLGATGLMGEMCLIKWDFAEPVHACSPSVIPVRS